jgi:hypothetical protein
MYCNESSAVLVDCTFYGNTSEDGGGGLLCEDDPVRGSPPSLTNVTFSANTAALTGGGMTCWNSSPTLTDCAFYSNVTLSGGGLACHESSPDLLRVTFWGNTGDADGGGVFCAFSSSPTLTNCSFWGNSGDECGGLVAGNSSHPVIENSLFAFAARGSAINCYFESSATLYCTDVYGNAGGDWEGCIQAQQHVHDNFSEDPFFCDAEGGDLTLDVPSPCCAENNQACGLVGAWGIGCDTPVRPVSWGELKARFR